MNKRGVFPLFLKKGSVPFFIISLGLFFYWNSFQGVFLFDDYSNILEYQPVTSWEWPWAFLQNNRRPFLYFTFAINHALGGVEPFGYHLVNLAVHILGALILFGIITRTLSLCLREEGPRKLARLWALGVSLFWLLHPIQTQSVTYMVQRAESLMGMLYLLGLYASLRYFSAPKVASGRGWMALAVVACVLSGLTKEVAVTAPVLIFMYDRTFFSLGWREAWRRHRSLYMGLGLVWVIMFYLLFTQHPEQTPTAGFAYTGIHPLTYALNQGPVLLHYLRLVVWPAPLVFDYLWAEQSLLKLVPALFVVLMCFGCSIMAFLRKSLELRGLGFLGLSFFILLAPSSSVIPLKDLAFEYRMYLPLASAGMLIFAGFGNLILRIGTSETMRRNISTGLICFIVVSLGIMTFYRNKVYSSELLIWRDTLEKRADNARAYCNLGKYLAVNGELEQAVYLYSRAIALDHGYADAYLNMGSALASLGRLKESIQYSMTAIKLRPDYPVAYNNLGASLSQLGRYPEAIIYYQKALEMDFREPGVYVNLGIAFAQTGRPEDAIDQMQHALRLDPELEQALDYLEQIQTKLLNP